MHSGLLSLIYYLICCLFLPVAEAVVEADSSSSLFGQMTFILIMAFAGLAVLVILIAGFILYRRRNLKSKHMSTSVDVEKLQKNPMYAQHSNYYVNSELLRWTVPRNGMEFIKELGPGNGECTCTSILDLCITLVYVAVVRFLVENSYTC